MTEPAPGLCEAYVLTMNVIATMIPERPLPTGVNACEVGDWNLAVNASREPLKHEGTEIEPWHVIAQHKEYFVIAVFGPGGGLIGGGMPEGEFIDQMRALAPENAP